MSETGEKTKDINGCVTIKWLTVRKWREGRGGPILSVSIKSGGTELECIDFYDTYGTVVGSTDRIYPPISYGATASLSSDKALFPQTFERRLRKATLSPITCPYDSEGDQVKDPTQSIEGYIEFHFNSRLNSDMVSPHMFGKD
jgi:hypothetical protein